MKNQFWDIYFNSDLWVTDDPKYFDNLEAYELCMKYRDKHAELYEEFKNGKYFILLGFFFITAEK